MRPVELRLHSDGQTEKYSGNSFCLQDAQKEGYTFLGWKDGNGSFVRRLYVTAEPADLYAVFEEIGENDGRELARAALLQPNRQYEIIMRGTEDLTDEWYFRLDISGTAEIVLEYSGRIYNGDNIFYISPAGTETHIMPGDSLLYQEGGYFVFRYIDHFTSSSATIYYSIL